MVTEHAANRKQTATHEHSKRNREWATFWALVTAVGAAILTLIVAHCDNRAIISEAQQVADQQHKDTLAALDKTEASIATLKEQTTTMRSQLTEMHQASVDIAELVKSANDTEERQLRAYVGITGDITLHCFSCNIKTFYPFSPPHSI
jgi:cell division protein FtsB